MALNYAYIRDSEVLNTLRVDFYKDGMVFNYDKDLTLTAQWRL